MFVTITLLSIIVGIPITITGIPSVSFDIDILELFTPLPGTIPLFVIWIVLFNLSIDEVASASIIIKKSGFVSLVIELKFSFEQE